MNDPTLACKMEISPINSKEFALAFKVSNPGTQAVSVEYYEPYADFELKAYADDGEVPLIQPAYDTAVRSVRVAIAAGETVRITTLIRLQFDIAMRPTSGEDQTLWTLSHVPAPVRLQVTMKLDGATVTPCETYFDPRV